MSGGARIVGSLVVIGVVAAASAAWYVRGPGPMDFSGGSKVALAEYKDAKPTGVPAKLAQASLIERGAYLARAADCMVCHTAQGGKEYAGGLPFKLAFGTLYSTNITPDKDTGIGADLTELRRTVESLDPKEATKTRKLLGIIPFGNKLNNYFDSYRSSQTHIQQILKSLQGGKDVLLMDNAAIDVER